MTPQEAEQALQQAMADLEAAQAAHPEVPAEDLQPYDDAIAKAEAAGDALRKTARASVELLGRLRSKP